MLRRNAYLEAVESEVVTGNEGGSLVVGEAHGEMVVLALDGEVVGHDHALVVHLEPVELLQLLLRGLHGLLLLAQLARLVGHVVAQLLDHALHRALRRVPHLLVARPRRAPQVVPSGMSFLVTCLTDSAS